jgi:hypothetical protein
MDDGGPVLLEVGQAIVLDVPRVVRCAISDAAWSRQDGGVGVGVRAKVSAGPIVHPFEVR